MNNSKYKLVIFETNISDGIMSPNKKFYPKDYTDKQIETEFLNTRLKAGKKYGFDGRKILRPKQKDVKFINDYPDGKYVKITNQNLTKEDYWDEEIIADILTINKNYPNIVIGHYMADCPILIAEDTKNKVVAISHCGSKQINREVPRYTIEALLKEANSNIKDIKVYIGSCIKEKNYCYDRYPKWATNTKVWKNNINKKDNYYYIDLISSIKNQLYEQGIAEKQIKVSPYDTYTHPNYYSHTNEVRNEAKPNGQNFVGCFYKEI